eukprot:1996-Pelagococcus_subviridis.AAC.2
MGGEERRAKSSRNGVRHANAVVWGPVYGTRLRAVEKTQHPRERPRRAKVLRHRDGLFQVQRAVPPPGRNKQDVPGIANPLEHLAVVAVLPRRRRRRHFPPFLRRFLLVVVVVVVAVVVAVFALAVALVLVHVVVEVHVPLDDRHRLRHGGPVLARVHPGGDDGVPRGRAVRIDVEAASASSAAGDEPPVVRPTVLAQEREQIVGEVRRRRVIFRQPGRLLRESLIEQIHREVVSRPVDVPPKVPQTHLVPAHGELRVRPALITLHRLAAPSRVSHRGPVRAEAGDYYRRVTRFEIARERLRRERSPRAASLNSGGRSARAEEGAARATSASEAAAASSSSSSSSSSRDDSTTTPPAAAAYVSRHDRPANAKSPPCFRSTHCFHRSSCAANARHAREQRANAASASPPTPCDSPSSQSPPRQRSTSASGSVASAPRPRRRASSLRDASEEETRYRFPSGRTPSGCGRMRSRARSSSVVSERSRWSRELFHCARAVGRHFRWRAWPGRPPFWDGTAPRALVANARTLARARVPSIGGALAVRLARPSLEVAVAARRDARASATPPRPRTSA